MSLYEYDEELHIRSEKEIAKQEGIEEGRAEERKRIFETLSYSMYKKGITIQEIADILELSPEEVKTMLHDQR